MRFNCQLRTLLQTSMLTYTILFFFIPRVINIFGTSQGKNLLKSGWTKNIRKRTHGGVTSLFQSMRLGQGGAKLASLGVEKIRHLENIGSMRRLSSTLSTERAVSTGARPEIPVGRFILQTIRSFHIPIFGIIFAMHIIRASRLQDIQPKRTATCSE